MTSDANDGGVALPTADDDPYTWLEEVEDARALEWVEQRNAAALAKLAGGARFAQLRERILEVLDSEDRIPLATIRGPHAYNFWQDAAHERGVWRRTTPESYETETPEWDVLLDLDRLSREEGVDWVWHGAQLLRPGFDRALIELSRGGSDADETREFDLTTRAFVETGFHRPEAKGSVSWVSRDELLVATDFGPGTMSSSGYPLQARRWTRGTELADAEVVFHGEDTDMLVAAWHDPTPGFERDFAERQITFFTSRLYLLTDSSHIEVHAPDSADKTVWREWLFVRLREHWRGYQPGTLLVARLAEALAGKPETVPLVLSTATRCLQSVCFTREHVVETELDDVNPRSVVETPPAGGRPYWSGQQIGGDVGHVSVSYGPLDPIKSDEVWRLTTGFLAPARLARGLALDEPREVKRAPAFFDATGLQVTQRFTQSDDGTRVPYFLVAREDLPLDGTTPTLLYGYGGFEISETPSYSGVLGRAWLERGYAYAVANIRGGGEYGPRWHQAALTRDRHRAYEDFAAVARDLTASGVTSAGRLGCMGGSNGGLLTGNMLTHYPELFGAIVIRVPLLDMRRYSHLLAGASWVAEYGDPDDQDQWTFIRTFSPYHLLDSARHYPPVLLTTSTRDDRVHPAHARKMTAALESLGADVTYYENTEGGHAGASTHAQQALMQALAYEFLADKLTWQS